MCNDKQRLELCPATSAIEITRASPLPPTFHTMPILFGKHKCHVKLWWATCSDAHPCFHPTPPFFRYQHFGLTTPVGKKETGLSSSSPGQCASKRFLSLKATILDPQVLTKWPAISKLSRLAILWHPFYILHPSVHSFRYQHFWFNQTASKEGRGSIIILSRSMRVKARFKPEGNHSRPPGADWWPAIST